MKFIISNEEKIIIDSTEDKCKSCVDKCISENNNVTCPIYSDNRRYGVKQINNKKIFLCTTKKEAKTRKLFDEKINVLVYTLPAIEKIKNEAIIEAKSEEKNNYSKIVHNLKTLNAQSIQSQYKFIPQSSFADNHSSLQNFVKNEIITRPDEATIAFLRLAKNNAHMKTEFSTHEKLSVESPNLSVQFHNIKSVILNVYHSFNIDFKSKNIRLNIFEDDNYIKFDYETVRVAFYHLFLNTYSYICANSNLDIEIYVKDTNVFIDFCMLSLHINEHEKSKLFDDGYSGENAIKSNTNSSGLGMGLIKKALTINNADIEVINGNEKIKRNENLYSKNIFRLQFEVSE